MTWLCICKTPARPPQTPSDGCYPNTRQLLHAHTATRPCSDSLNTRARFTPPPATETSPQGADSSLGKTQRPEGLIPADLGPNPRFPPGRSGGSALPSAPPGPTAPPTPQGGGGGARLTLGGGPVEAHDAVDALLRVHQELPPPQLGPALRGREPRGDPRGGRRRRPAAVLLHPLSASQWGRPASARRRRARFQVPKPAAPCRERARGTGTSPAFVVSRRRLAGRSARSQDGGARLGNGVAAGGRREGRGQRWLRAA